MRSRVYGGPGGAPERCWISAGIRGRRARNGGLAAPRAKSLKTLAVHAYVANEMLREVDEMAEVDEIVYRDWEEAARGNATLSRIVSGIATLLELKEGELRRHVAKILPRCLLDDCVRQDMMAALAGTVERIYNALLDPDAWNAYADRPGPSAYRYAAAIAAYMYLLADQVCGLVPPGCPLFGPRVASLILLFLATRQAPGESPVKDAIYDAVIEHERQTGRRVADPLDLCRPQ